MSSASTIKKAEKLAKTVQQPDPNEQSYLVQGSKYTDEFGKEVFKQYEVQKVDGKENYEFVCNDSLKRELCIGWKFSSNPKECKHVWAVKIYLQNQEELKN